MKNKHLLLFVISLLLCGCNNNARKVDKRFTLANLGNDVDFHTELQQDYLLDEDYENVPSVCDGNTELSIPNAIKLTWDVSEDIESFVVGIGEKQDLSDQKEYHVEGKKELELYNWTLPFPMNKSGKSTSKTSFSDNVLCNPASNMES